LTTESDVNIISVRQYND